MPDDAGVSAYPLAWPRGRFRTLPSMRRASSFRTGRGQLLMSDARSRVGDELERIGGRFPVLSTNMELRADGQIHAGAAAPHDPGVALYFRLRDRPMVLACDRWLTVAGNIAAIAAHIEALRGQERWGVGTIEQAFAGFLALPPPVNLADWRALLGDPRTLADAESAYRAAMRTAHPDAGGSAAAAAALNAAITAARAALS